MFGVHRPLDLAGFESMEFSMELAGLAERNNGEMIIAHISSIALTLVTREEVRRLVRQGSETFERKEFHKTKASIKDSIRNQAAERLAIQSADLVPDIDSDSGNVLVLRIDDETNIYKYVANERTVAYKAVADKVGARVKKVPKRDNRRLVIGVPLYPEGQNCREEEDFRAYIIGELTEFLIGCPDVITLDEPKLINANRRSSEAPLVVE